MILQGVIGLPREHKAILVSLCGDGRDYCYAAPAALCPMVLALVDTPYEAYIKKRYSQGYVGRLAYRSERVLTRP